MNSKSFSYVFCSKKLSKKFILKTIESLTFLFPNFPVLLGSSTSYCHIQTLVQRHKVLRRPPSVGMPRHALRRRMPNTAGLRPRSPARWAGVIPQLKIRPAGRVLPAVQNQNPPSRKRHVKRAIFLFNHTNFTIFCMRPWNGHTRRSSCWRFAM